MGTFLRSIGELRWRWILPAGALVGVLGVVLPYQSVGAYSMVLRVVGGREASPERVEEAAYFLMVWAAPVAFLLMSGFAASWVARRVGEAPVNHGAATGIVAAAVVEALASVAYPPFRIGELVQYVVLGAFGGYLGGAEARSSLRVQDALYSASVAIGGARSAAEVVGAFGGRMASAAGFDAVDLWRETRGEELCLWASWEGPDDPGVGRTLPSAAGEIGRRGGGSRLVMPLTAPGGEPIGVLVASSGERAPFAKGAARACRTAAAQAALALTNIRLLEEAKEAGERAGVLVERQRVAREIHDALAQSFASISLGLGAARSRMGAAGGAADEESRGHLEQAEVTAREGLAEARRLVWALRPEALEKRSLGEALQKLAAGFSKESGVDAAALTDGERRALRPEVEVALLRVAQEALSNVRKHAGASRAMVSLTFLDDVVVLDVRDDGSGFDPGLREAGGREDLTGFGLFSMRERAEGVGGSLQVESAVGEGTVVTMEVALGAGAGLPS